MRFLLAGAYRWPWYEKACARALESLGHEVERFAWDSYFQGRSGHIQRHLLWGPAVSRLNEDLALASQKAEPEVVLVWRGGPVRPATLRRIRDRTGALLVCRNNDDPFGPRAPWSTWRLFRSGVPLYDLHLAYRPCNLPEYRAAGASRVRLLLPYYVPDLHRPMELSDSERAKFGCEVVFVGHFEPDGRVEHLRALVDAGVDVKLWGGDTWGRDSLGDLWRELGPVEPALGADYARALGGAGLCLNFLSARNRDTYTRRCFEIPACGRPLVSQGSEDLRRLFTEGEEAIFFDSPEDLVQRVRGLLADQDHREALARNGRRRVREDGHDVDSRMRELVAACREAGA